MVDTRCNPVPAARRVRPGMRPLVRSSLARLGAACLTVAASLPGPLQLVHRHAGGEHVHVHADAEALAAHDLLEDHLHRHADGHSHAHAETRSAAEHTHPHAAPAAGDGPALRAADGLHVHGLNPFHQATCGTVSCDTLCATVARAKPTARSAPRAALLRAARPRGPPANLVG